MAVEIRSARPEDVDRLMPLLRGYCEFYEADPPDDALRRMIEGVISLPEDREFALVAEDESGELAGVAVCAWRWSSLRGARTIYLADLFVRPESRGSGAADALLDGVAEVGRRHGAAEVTWLTGPDNARARAVYDRAGARAEPYLEYELEL